MNVGNLLVAVGTAIFVVIGSLSAALFILCVNGSPTVEGNLTSAEAIEAEQPGLPKLNTGKFIIDTDAGVDDAVALFLALGHEAKQPNTSTKIIAITCVNGNTKVDNVVVNVLKVLKTANRLDIPVFRGAPRSLLKTPHIDDYFGKDGLGDFVYPNPPNPEDYVTKEHAASAFVRFAATYPKQVTLLCLGPLTNVALATRLDSNFISNLKQLIILGGSVEGVGNIMPGVEFNFYVDPEANLITFDSVNATNNDMNPIVLIPLESTVRRNLVSMKWRKEVLGSVRSPPIHFLNLAERDHGDTTDWLASDAMAAAVTIDPSLVIQASPRYHATPEIQGTSARGALFVDYMHVLKDAPTNVVIIEKINVPRYKDILLNYLS